MYTTYITHYRIRSPHRIAIRTLITTIVSSIFAYAGDTVGIDKDGTELAAIALTWFSQDDLYVRLLMFDVTYLVKKALWLEERISRRKGSHNAHGL